MNVPGTACRTKLHFCSIPFVLIAMFLITFPFQDYASALEGKIRETMDEVTHHPSITLNILQRESKAKKEHQAVALKCGLYGFVSKVHLGPLKNENPDVVVKLRFDEELETVETWRWDQETAVAYSTSVKAFNRFFGKQILHLELSADPDFMNPLEGNFQLATLTELLNEFQEKCQTLGWEATTS